MRVSYKDWLKPQALFNISLWLLMAFLLIQRAPSWIDNFRIEGETVSPFNVIAESGAPQIFPIPASRQIIVFWATWCKPCELELGRFNRAVKAKELPADAIVAISVGEESAVVFAAARERGYAFEVFADPSAAATRSLPVQGTPQVYHVDELARIRYASMGLSPLSIFHAKRFMTSGK